MHLDILTATLIQVTPVEASVFGAANVEDSFEKGIHPACKHPVDTPSTGKRLAWSLFHHQEITC